MRLTRLIAATFSLVLLPMVACLRVHHSDTVYAIPRNPSGSLYVTQHAGMADAASRFGMKSLLEWTARPENDTPATD